MPADLDHREDNQHTDAVGASALAQLPAGNPSPDARLDDLAQIIRAYNEVTEKLQVSHESLKAQVVRLQSELASTNAKLQRSKRLAALGEMAAGIAHEIRNPLAAIQLYAGMIVDDLRTGSPSTQEQFGPTATAQKIVSAVRGLDAVVNDVLAFAREVAPNPVSVQVSQAIDRAVDACSPAITLAGISIDRHDRRDGLAQGSLSVYADPSLLHQAMLNLIRNAVDAMSDSTAHPSRQTPPRLAFDVSREESYLTLTVRDSGPGIAQRDIDRIFNPFFTTRNTGTGLGLAIVHRIVDAHGGTISVHNNGGAVFELTLPIEPDSDQQHPDPSRAEVLVSASRAGNGP